MNDTIFLHKKYLITILNNCYRSLHSSKKILLVEDTPCHLISQVHLNILLFKQERMLHYQNYGLNLKNIYLNGAF